MIIVSGEYTSIVQYIIITLFLIEALFLEHAPIGKIFLARNLEV